MTALPSGHRLGPYDIVAPLGAGGMGEVYRARDTRLGRDVAVKALPAAAVADPERISRFRREAQILAGLTHPHIATLYGLEEADDSQFLVMELVEGGTLATRLASGPLAVRDALTIARQIADALQAAHDRGIIHRDLKPANIAFTAEGHSKVLDFGLAKALVAEGNAATVAADATKSGVVLGTVAYMSPEQARGQPLDKRTDIFSFGCVFYEMLTARNPFARSTLSDTVLRSSGANRTGRFFPARHPSACGGCCAGVSRRMRGAGCTTLPTHASSWTRRSPPAPIPVRCRQQRPLRCGGPGCERRPRGRLPASCS